MIDSNFFVFRSNGKLRKERDLNECSNSTTPVPSNSGESNVSCSHSYLICKNQGSVYTNAVSFVTASLSMRLHLPFTRRRSRPLPKPGRFENADKSGAFSKRYGFICRANGETASI